MAEKMAQLLPFVGRKSTGLFSVAPDFRRATASRASMTAGA
ncbi:hypothetical protein [Limimaricola soesokkakensis]